MSSLNVTATGAAAEAISAHVPDLVNEKFASRLFAQDATLWGPAAEAESAKRLSWVGLPRSSRPLVGQIAALRSSFTEAGLDHVVLCGMGGSSLAPEVICATAGVPLVVLDSSDPDYVRGALADSLDRTIVVVSSKSGSTVETDSQKRAYEAAFRGAGIDPTERIVIVTDPGSPLDQAARTDGYTVINADPNVGGRYSALTAFGLVPSGLAGADISALLDDAEAVADLLDQDDAANPGLRLGAAMGGTNPLRDKLLLVDDGTQIKGFGDWAEQLIAESTGKDGKGILPVVINDSEDVALYLDGTVVWLAADDAALTDGEDGEDSAPGAAPAGGDSEVTVSGSLGASLLLWEVATAVAGRLLDINPFDQPDVESAKKAARALLDSGVGAADAPAATDGAVQIRALGQDGTWLGDAHTVAAAVDALVAQLDPNHGYLAIMAYLDRLADADFADVTPHISEELGRPATFGWGPRFLHSTGQYHKGGPDTGVYLQVTAEPKEDLAIPGRDFTFGQFIASQAGGDASVLAAKGRPVLQLHLTDHDAGLQQVRAALTALGAGKAHS